MLFFGGGPKYCTFSSSLLLFASRSEGHLCLPVRYTHSFPEALQKLYRGEFRYDLVIFGFTKHVDWKMHNNV